MSLWLVLTIKNDYVSVFVIPPYPFGKKSFPRTPCIGTDNKDGICLSHAQCIARNGAPAGSCAQNQGVCCVCKYFNSVYLNLKNIQLSSLFYLLFILIVAVKINVRPLTKRTNVFVYNNRMSKKNIYKNKSKTLQNKIN